jgi:hypothetical protein
MGEHLDVASTQALQMDLITQCIDVDIRAKVDFGEARRFILRVSQ